MRIRPARWPVPLSLFMLGLLGMPGVPAFAADPCNPALPSTLVFLKKERGARLFKDSRHGAVITFKCFNRKDTLQATLAELAKVHAHRSSVGPDSITYDLRSGGALARTYLLFSTSRKVLQFTFVSGNAAIPGDPSRNDPRWMEDFVRRAMGRR